ncbi:MAG: pca operon transcription factor PcaQ [Azospirillaceae bacterium]|nr:pca operon transcription factor PcaQ [Azospirillaceae bacterium]
MIDGRIKLRHLACFWETARLKSVVKAAAVLHVTQPAVSKSIQELEALLDAPLFDRSRRQLGLTDLGEVFFRYAGASLTALRQGIDSVARTRAADAVTVTVGALPTVSGRILPAVVARFTATPRAPTLRIITGPNAYLLSQLRQGDLDLVIGRMGDSDTMTGLAFEHLYSEKIVLLVRPDHPLLQPDAFDISSLAAWQVVLPPPDAAIRPAVDRFLIAHGVGHLANVIETVSLAFGRRYVRLSDAIWIISEGVVAEELEEGRLRHLPLGTADTMGPVGLTTQAGMTLPVPTRLFIDAVRQCVARMPRSG